MNRNLLKLYFFLLITPQKVILFRSWKISYWVRSKRLSAPKARLVYAQCVNTKRVYYMPSIYIYTHNYAYKTKPIQNKTHTKQNAFKTKRIQKTKRLFLVLILY